MDQLHGETNEQQQIRAQPNSTRQHGEVDDEKGAEAREQLRYTGEHLTFLSVILL